MKKRFVSSLLIWSLGAGMMISVNALDNVNSLSKTMVFEDVSSNSYCYDAVLWAVKAGLTEGTSETMFSPDEKCAKGQIVAFMYRNYGQTNVQKSEIRVKAEKEIAESAEKAAEIEKKLRETYIQADLNRYSAQIYQIWDDELNRLWGHLQDTLKKDEMDALREDEFAWISYKEEEVDAAGGEFAGGSMEPCARNIRGAELTKARVYELLKYLQ